MVRGVACEERGPGFNSSIDQLVFLLSSGIRRYEKIGSRHDKLRDLAYPFRSKGNS